jgi:hypothetical protein
VAGAKTANRRRSAEPIIPAGFKAVSILSFTCKNGRKGIKLSMQ